MTAPTQNSRSRHARSSAPANHPAGLKLGVVILGAGASSRMGRPKLLLPWGQTTIVGHLRRMWEQVEADQIAIVVAPVSQAPDVHAELDRLQWPQADRIVNPDPDRGMFSSIQCAAGWPGWRPDLSHWAIALGDQPHLQASTLRALIEAVRQRPSCTCQPSRQGRARHPVLMPKNVFLALAETSAATLRDYLAELGAARVMVEVEDPGLEMDLDRPEDYAMARREFWPGTSQSPQRSS